VDNRAWATKAQRILGLRAAARAPTRTLKQGVLAAVLASLALIWPAAPSQALTADDMSAAFAVADNIVSIRDRASGNQSALRDVSRVVGGDDACGAPGRGRHRAQGL